jgi:crotonobetainyl-CoA:carnitine CoA-transferase CaiB-like acyl-CoA transferase
MIGILAALHHRQRTGRGQHVEASLLASALSGLVNQTGAYAVAGAVPHRLGNAHLSIYPYETMPTKDRDVVIAAANDRQFGALCDVLGIPEVAADPRFAINEDRTRNRHILHPILVARLAEWSADDLFLTLNSVGVPCGPINSVAEGFALAERLGLHPVIDIGEGDRHTRLVRHPLEFSEAEVSYQLPPPVLGEHTDEIKRWLRS